MNIRGLRVHKNACMHHQIEISINFNSLAEKFQTLFVCELECGNE